MDYCLSNVLLLPGNKQYADEKVVPLWIGSGKNSKIEEATADDGPSMIGETMSTACKSPSRSRVVSFGININRSERLNNQSDRNRKRSTAATPRELHAGNDGNSSRIKETTQNSAVNDSSMEELWQYVRNIAIDTQITGNVSTMMTSQYKQMLYRAVQSGDIDLVDEMLLLLPGADINMTWYSENLLMAATRARQTDMAIFLLDNGINRHYSTTRIDATSSSGQVTGYSITCRQMAYERGLSRIVDVIDELNGDSWPTFSPRRQIRLRRTVSQLITSSNDCDDVDNNEMMTSSLNDKARSSIVDKQKDFDGENGTPEMDVISLMASQHQITSSTSTGFKPRHVVVAPYSTSSSVTIATTVTPSGVTAIADRSPEGRNRTPNADHVTSCKFNGRNGESRSGNSKSASSYRRQRSDSTNTIVNITDRPVSVRLIVTRRTRMNSPMNSLCHKTTTTGNNDELPMDTGNGTHFNGDHNWPSVRVISPWKEDDPETVKRFENRSSAKQFSAHRKSRLHRVPRGTKTFANKDEITSHHQNSEYHHTLCFNQIVPACTDL